MELCVSDELDEAVFVAFDMEMEKLANIQAAEAAQILGACVNAHVDNELPHFVAWYYRQNLHFSSSSYGSLISLPSTKPSPFPVSFLRNSVHHSKNLSYKETSSTIALNWWAKHCCRGITLCDSKSPRDYKWRPSTILICCTSKRSSCSKQVEAWSKWEWIKKAHKT